MSAVLIAEFMDADALLDAAKQSDAAGDRLIDSFSPFPVEGMAELLGETSTRLRLVMAIGGLAIATLMLGTEYFSAVVDYPINSGGRPLNSWPAFMLPPFAVGILGAAIFGFIAFCWQTGLPRLHHPLFAIDDFGEASQQRFLLAVKAAHDDAVASAHNRLKQAGAVAVREVSA